MAIGKHQQQIRKEGKQEGIQEGKQEGAKTREKEIARQMLKEGEKLEKIRKYTGLTAQWLGRLKAQLEDENKQ